MRKTAGLLMAVLAVLCAFGAVSLAQPTITPELLWSKLSAPNWLGNLQFSPDGQWVVYGRGLYRASQDWLTESVPVHYLEGEAWFAGKNLLVLYERDRGRVVLRHLPSLRPVQVLATVPGGRVEAQASADGEYLALLVGGEVSLWKMKPPRRVLAWNVSFDPYACRIALSANGARLAYSVDAQGAWGGYGAGTVSVRDTATGREMARFDFQAPPYAIALSPDGETIAVSHDHISVYRIADRQLIYRFEGQYYPPSPSPDLVISPDGRYLAASTRAYYHRPEWALWRLSDGAQIAGEDGWLLYGDMLGAQFSADSASLYLLAMNGVRQVDVNTGSVVREVRQRVVQPVGVVAGGSQVAVVEAVGEALWLVLHRAEDGTELRRVRLPLDEMPAENTISADLAYFAAAFQNRLVLIALPPAGDGVLLWETPAPVSNLCFSPDGSKLLAIRWQSGLYGSDPELVAFDAPSGEVMPVLLGVLPLQFTLSADGATWLWLATASWGYGVPTI